MNSFSKDDKWKHTLSKAIHVDESIGASDNAITCITEVVGDFFAKNNNIENQEEKVLKELWNVANEHDKHVLAKLVVKMTKNN